MKPNAATRPPVKQVPASLEDYRPALSRFFARRIADPAEVEDLVQEALLRLVATGCNGQGPDNPQAWLFKVAQNLVADHFRRPRHVGLEPLELMEQALPERPTQEDARQYADLQYLMEEALAELSATCQAIFIMRRFEERDTAEIARRLGISRRMVQKYLVQAVTHLYVRLAPITEDRR